MVTRLSHHLVENSYKVTLLVIDKSAESFYPVHPNVVIRLLPADFGIGGAASYVKRKLNFLSDIQKLREVVFELKPDFLITTDYPFTAVGYISLLYKKCKMICWQHGIFQAPASTLWKFFARLGYRHAQAVVALNEDEATILKKYNHHVAVIPNFIEPAEKAATLSNPFILTIAQLAAHKGIDLLLKAADIIFQKHTEWK